MNEAFIIDGSFNLIHTEYPTPFKNSLSRFPPYFKIEAINSNSVRSHIDLVLLNPEFFMWINKFKNYIHYLKGLKNELFSKYILEFYNVYAEFSD